MAEVPQSGVLLRAVYFHESLAKLGALSPPLLEVARRELPGRAFAPVSPLAWLPVEWSNQLDAVVLREAGEHALLELYRSTTVRAQEEPVYATLLRAAGKLTGHGPWAILHWLPAAWSLTTKNFGVVTCVRTDGGARLSVAHMPTFIREFEGFRPCIRGSLLGLVDMFGYDSEVTTRDEGTSVVFDMRWWRAPSPPQA